MKHTMIENAERQRGSILVIVLWIGMLLSMLSLGLIENSRTSTKYVIAARDISQAKALAETGVNRAIIGLLDPSPATHWIAGGTYELQQPTGSVTIAIEDEAGKVDLNAAPQSLLQAVISISNLETNEADALVDAIMDWRDPDSLVHLNGAETKQYQAAGLAYGAKNAPFDNVDELRLVLGMTQETFVQIAPTLTVYSHQTSIDTSVISPLLRQAFAISDAQLHTNSNSASSGMVSPSATPRLIGRTFTVRAIAETLDGNLFERIAIVRITGLPKRPFEVLSWWRESDGGS